MILRIYLVVANTIIGWFWVCQNSQQQQHDNNTSPRYAQLLRPPKLIIDITPQVQTGFLDSLPRARSLFFFFGSNSGFFYWVHHDDHVEFNQQCWTLWFAPSGRGRILFGWLFSCAVFTAIASYTKPTTRRTGNVQTSARAHQSVFTISNVWPRRFIDSRVLICL